MLAGDSDSFPNQQGMVQGTRQRVLVYHTYMAARRPKSNNRPTSNEAQIDTGGGQKDAVNAALVLGLVTAGGAVALGGTAMRNGRIVRTVSDAAKKEQKNLSQLQKEFSGKDLKKIQNLKQVERNEIMTQRYQSAFDDAVSPSTLIKMQRDAVSEAMKSSKGSLKYIKKK